MGSYSSFVAAFNERATSAARKRAASLRPEERLVLVRDRANPVDENAVQVESRDRITLGYLPRRHASWVAERLDGGNFVAAYVDFVETEPGFFSAKAVDIKLTIATTVFDLPFDDPERERAEGQAVADRMRAGAVKQLKGTCKAGLCVLRFLGEAGQTDQDRQANAIDDFILQRATAANLTPDADTRTELRSYALSLKGTRQAAVKALDEIANDEAHVRLLATYAEAMVRADGEVRPEEIDALRIIVTKLKKLRGAAG